MSRAFQWLAFLSAILIVPMMPFQSAQAGTVSFSTTNTKISQGGWQITFTGTGPVTVTGSDANPVRIGTFTVTSTGNGNPTLDGQFTLFIIQSSPTAGADVPLVGQLDGKIKSGLGVIDFSGGYSTTIGTVTYNLVDFDLMLPKTKGAVVPLYANIAVAQVPEPSLLILLGIGMGVVALAAWRLKK